MSSLPNRRMEADWTKALSGKFCYYSALQKALILSCILPPFNGESIEKQPESTGIVKCKKRDFVSLSEVSFSRILKCKQDVIKGCRQIMDEVLTTDEQSGQIAKLQDQAVGLAQRIRELVNENARTQMANDEFTPGFDR